MAAPVGRTAGRNGLRSLKIQLEFEADGNHRVLLCEVAQGGRRSRSSWREEKSLFQVFTADFAGLLADALLKVTKPNELISLPDFSYESLDLTLHTLVVTANARAKGGTMITIHFKHFIGALSSVLADDISGSGASDLAIEGISDRVLLELCLPLLNICRMDQFGTPLRDLSAEEFVDQLLMQAGEIEFHVELLKRHIARKDRQRAELAFHQEAAASQMAQLSSAMTA